MIATHLSPKPAVSFINFNFVRFLKLFFSQNISQFENLETGHLYHMFNYVLVHPHILTYMKQISLLKSNLECVYYGPKQHPSNRVKKIGNIVLIIEFQCKYDFFE